MPVLADFADALGLAEPIGIVADPRRFLPAIAQYMSSQEIEPADRVWAGTRIGYLIGEVLVQSMSGCWYLNDQPESRHFGRYVVGQFPRLPPQTTVDPFEVAFDYLDHGLGRSLVTQVERVEAELRTLLNPSETI
jgi:hypothetical protein